MKNPETNAPSTNAKYASPELVVFGSVRNLTGGSQAVGTDNIGPNDPGANRQSDRRTKENIVQIDSHPAGFGLYLFDYKEEFRDRNGHGRQFGVMADEVVEITPEAVSIADNGYAMVNYAKLGITRH